MKLLLCALALGTASCAPRARPPAARARLPLHPLARARSAAINLSEVESHAAKALTGGGRGTRDERLFHRKTRDIERALREKLRRLRVGPSLRRQFRRFDRAGGGTLTRREFARAVQALGMDLARRNE